MKKNKALFALKNKLFSLVLTTPLLVAASCSEKETVTPTPDIETTASPSNARLGDLISVVQNPGPGQRGSVIVNYSIEDTPSDIRIRVIDANNRVFRDSGVFTQQPGDYSYTFSTRRFPRNAYLVEVYDVTNSSSRKKTS